MTIGIREIFPKPDSEISWDNFVEESIRMFKTYIRMHYENTPMQISLLDTYLLGRV